MINEIIIGARVGVLLDIWSHHFCLKSSKELYIMNDPQESIMINWGKEGGDSASLYRI